MPKKTFLILFALCISGFAKAQSADSVYNRYLDFNLAKLQSNLTEALNIGESLLPNVSKLPAKSQVTFYNGLAKIYEDYHQSDKATHYYEIVVAAEPDYYVVHRALGYLYLEAVDGIYKKIKAAGGDKNSTLIASYKNAVLKALPHLEKAQACDPSDDTLNLIKTLYTNIDDKQSINSLSTRLAGLGKNCVSILSE